MESHTIRPLIVFSEGQYRVDADTAEWLSQRTRPFGVLACAGKFRTGKSFLMNRLLSCAPGRGFGVGETVQPCTRGIWLCTTFLTLDGRDVLVLDTEGIDALDAENAHDVRVFALAVLMCSSFAYNSMSHLDEAAVQTLSLMTRITEAVGEEGAHAPSLYWILRDFSLQLVDGQGNAMSHGEYLEQALTPPSGSAKCATRAAIKKVFPERHLVTLPRPQKGDTAQRLDGKAASSIHPRFEKFLSIFRTHVCTHVKPFTVAGVEVGGAVYVEHVRNLVDAVNRDGVVPKVEDSWSLLARAQHAEQMLVVRERVAERVRDACPRGPREHVATWISGAVRAALDAVQFLAPPPSDLERFAEQLSQTAMDDAVGMGRVRSVRDEATELCETLVEAFQTTHDPSHLVPNAENQEVRDMAAFLILSSRMEPLCSTLRASGALEKQRETLLELEQARHDALVAEERVRVLETHSPPPRIAIRMDACTQTEVEDEASIILTTATLEEDAANARMLVDLQSLLASADARASVAERQLEAVRGREEVAAQQFSAAMDALRAEAEARIASCVEEADHDREEAKTARSQREALKTEFERVRTMATEAQERTIELHKSTLDELRRRDAEARAIAEDLRSEQTELRVREEMTTNENRTLKRRVDELLIETEDARRQRVKMLSERAREDAERDALRTQASVIRGDLDALRASNVDLESRLAVLKATATLETCRRSIAASGGKVA